jgi:hypothetical protein
MLGRVRAAAIRHAPATEVAPRRPLCQPRQIVKEPSTRPLRAEEKNVLGI